MHSSSGHESHGVHLCNKCGWPFPNPHPSARHRRAHKKICGTVEGYKLLASQEDTAANSDEDPLSDEDLKTPTPKPAEKFVSDECGDGRTGERSNKSEDEFFSDAVTEFTDTSGFIPANEERLEDATPAHSKIEKITARRLTMFYSFKDTAVADIIEPSSNSISTDSSPMPNPEVHENTTNFSGSNLETQVHVSSSAEEPTTTFIDDRNELARALHVIKPATSNSESQGNIMNDGSADAAEGSMAYAEQVIDANGNAKINSDTVTDIILPNEYADQPSETDSKSQEIQDMTSHPFSADGVVLSKEDNDDAMAAKMSSGDLTPGIESVEHMNVIDTVLMNVNAKKELDCASSVNSIKGYCGKGKGNDNVHELSVSADIPVVEHAENKLKDHEGVKLNKSIDTDSLEIIENKKDDGEYSVPKVSASDLNVSESMPTVDKQSIEGESDKPQIKLTCNEKSDELGTPVASVIIATEESLPVGSVGKSPPYIFDDSLHKDFTETALNVFNDVNPMTAPEDANTVGLNDAGNHKKAISETNNVAGNDEHKRVEEENNDNNGTMISESATYRPEILVNPTTNVHESDDAGDHEKGKIENSAVVGVERGEESTEEKLSLKTKPASEYATTNLHELEVVADDVLDMTVMKLSETKFGNLDTVSDTQDGTEQLEISGNDKAQEKLVPEIDRGVELSKRTSEDQATKVPLASPFGTESSIQSSVAVDDNHTEGFGRGDSVTNLSLQGENIDNNFVKHQLGPSRVDVSVDSLSQTDSLEGNWGSISVLSTQSDTPVVDAESLSSTDYLASAETEKSIVKAKGATEGQQSSNSDVFEAPSFMTLVEPGGEVNHKAAAPQTQTIQNSQQQNAASSQAGWFPSLTHVVNESEGRKKNEEIIAKVTNWSTGKHTPLKNLLGEAKHDARPKSPNPKESQAHVIWEDETVSKDNGAAVTTVGSILGPEDTKREMGKEGNSPARYPADIKREKRKVKGRPIWAQLMCCSSVKY
ncbi:hypothetical protein Ddye_023447 [Dipteronia dyeriana]|uniref:C2H2-type domain-containing protein n=1 Tax=Dipteronia dyeriana TaxID=168575 RepID=A0AAD9WS44_9ROSI|nr:hypothetical protein Ddye_023447 [Dipteronia dyeriana]